VLTVVLNSSQIYELSGCLDIYGMCLCGHSCHADEFETKCSSIDSPPRCRPIEPAQLRIYRQTSANRPPCNSDRTTRYTASHMECNHFDMKVPTNIVQPSLTRVSKQVRNDTLSIFYGKHYFYFALRNITTDRKIITRWLRKIGPQNASLLRKLVIVYSKKENVRYYRKTLSKEMAALGVNVDGAVKVQRTKYPYCTCNVCVGRTVLEHRATVEGPEFVS